MEETETNKTKSAFVEFIHEAIGYENGMYRTVKDLKSAPNIVLNSYLNGEKVYTSPFKILMTVVTFWLFFSNLIIDWYSLWAKAYDWIFALEFKYIFHKPVPDLPLIRTMRRVYIQVAGDIFSKLYILLVIFGLPTWAYFCYLFSKKQNIPFRTHFAIVGYYTSLSFITSFIVIGILALNIYVGLSLVLIIFIARIFGLKRFYNIFMMTPVANFFDPPNTKIEKVYNRSVFLATVILFILLAIGYKLYFLISPI